MIEPVDLSPIVERLKSQLTLAHTVGGAADIAAALSATKTWPAVHVLEARDRATNASGSTLRRTNITSTFGVLYQVSARTDPSGEGARATLRNVRAEVWALLLDGYKPAGASRALSYAGGSIQQWDAKNMTQRWVDLFNYEWRLHA